VVLSRYTGSNAFSSASATPASCPMTKEKTDETSHPVLQNAPSLPFVGSLITKYSGVSFDMNTQYENGLEGRRRFGDFFTLGVPGFGTGLHGTLYSITDPNEMMKIVRNEGAHPSGLVEKIWALRKGLKDSNSAIVDGEDYGLLGKGERWKKQRTFLQTGMLCPKAARGFIPGIVGAAEMASEIAPSHANDLNNYLNYCAFDMFSSFMFGELTNTAGSVITTTTTGEDGNSCESNDENVKFVKAALGVFHHLDALGMSPWDYFMVEKIGIKTKQYRAFEDLWDTVREIGRKKLYSFMERHEQGNLNDIEKASYFASAIDRQASEGPDGISRDEMVELCLFALMVGVDTTSSVTAWNLMHLALNPTVQNKLHEELSAVVSQNGGKLDANVLSKSSTPYLHACIRESHRITPAFGQVMSKSNSKSAVEVHGVTLPKDSVTALAHISYDPTYVDNPRDFKPERWSAEAVSSRKGTRSELVDHPIYRDPFSQGARRCPGSRVATNEVLSIIAQLVLDWKITSPLTSLDDVPYDSGLIKPIMPRLEFTARA